jgi:hypothetical protein
MGAAVGGTSPDHSEDSEKGLPGTMSEPQIKQIERISQILYKSLLGPCGVRP